MDFSQTEINLVVLVVWFSYNSLPCVIVGFGESGDPSCVIMQIWAKIEVCSVTMTTVFKSCISVMLNCV